MPSSPRVTLAFRRIIVIWTDPSRGDSQIDERIKQILLTSRAYAGCFWMRVIHATMIKVLVASSASPLEARFSTRPPTIWRTCELILYLVRSSLWVCRKMMPSARMSAPIALLSSLPVSRRLAKSWRVESMVRPRSKRATRTTIMDGTRTGRTGAMLSIAMSISYVARIFSDAPVCYRHRSKIVQTSFLLRSSCSWCLIWDA